MKVDWTPHFEDQRKQFNLLFTCESCAYFDIKNSSCIHEFPNGMHTDQYYAQNPPPASILFCKEFELD